MARRRRLCEPDQQLRPARRGDRRPRRRRRRSARRRRPRERPRAHHLSPAANDRRRRSRSGVRRPRVGRQRAVAQHRPPPPVGRAPVRRRPRRRRRARLVPALPRAARRLRGRSRPRTAGRPACSARRPAARRDRRRRRLPHRAEPDVRRERRRRRRRRVARDGRARAVRRLRAGVVPRRDGRSQRVRSGRARRVRRRRLPDRRVHRDPRRPRDPDRRGHLPPLAKRDVHRHQDRLAVTSTHQTNDRATAGADGDPRVWVYGATGLTGQLVCEALRDRGVPFVAAGRDRARVDAVAARVGAAGARAAELHDPDAVRAALAGARVVVNCAGPFLRFGEAVLRGALAVGAHYLDTTGEQAFMREIYERYESAARRANRCVINGMAFEIALGDWAAALAAAGLGDGPAVDEIAVAYAVSGFHPSAGTRLSALAQLAADAVVWERDRWDPAPAVDRRTFAFPPPFGERTAVGFPSGEVITVPRHISVRRVRTYLALPPGPVGAVVARVGGRVAALARSPAAAWARRIAERAPPPTSGQRRANAFAVTATARRGFDSAQVTVSGSDVYGITARIAAFAADHLAAGRSRATGVVAPAQAFDALASLRALPVALTASYPLPARHADVDCSE
ncbi:MAG: hypothetical protein D6689_04260 [Deltaproteobacteria bacterium]|nr:MAG: hypothetical protein D6689_04260 [Deltaproteobacteria bacterium]